MTIPYEESIRETSPCKLCGSARHSLLTRMDGEDGKSMVHLDCPVAEQDEWINMPYFLSPTSQRYEVSRYRLAESLGYDAQE